MTNQVQSPTLSGHAGQIGNSAATMPTSGIRDVMTEVLNVSGIINLAPGEPSFPTPRHIVDAGIDALNSGRTKYTHHAGIAELRVELCRKLSEENGIGVAPDDVVVTHGAMGALYSAYLALLDPGDEILLPDPGWPNFRMMAALRSATVREYTLTREGGFVPDVEQLEDLISDKTRVILINSPLNPVGSVLTRDQVAEIVELANKYRIWIISDEAYERITYDVPHVSAGSVDPHGRVVSVFSFSKTYAMTGWRVGYAVAKPEVARVIANLQEATISCANAPGQWAALAALTGPQAVIGDMNLEYARRMKNAQTILKENGVEYFDPGGAFYLWIDVTSSGVSSAAFSRSLMDRYRVAVVPGSAFGSSGQGYVRTSVASSESDVSTGISFLAQHVRELADGHV